MDSFVRRQNIANFRSQLERERDPAKRAMLERLLAEEQERPHPPGVHESAHQEVGQKKAHEG